ncbi:TetR/AcrR family transcriptional regulator [Actinomadura scrupuli]|uniref:TetR/AcrR family transcriptional regulator n=1 Tax=Actinomadura scrupuli TaxID=559629 RepID=UPI003D9639AD
MVSGRRSAPARQDENTAPRRADAERNIAAIIAAGLELFGREANVSMADVARAAGLGRVTVYAHFPSRADLVEALMRHAIAEAEQAMDAGLTALADERGDQPGGQSADRLADQVLAGLIGSTWSVLQRHRRLRRHALADLGPERLHEYHDPVRSRMERLIAQGREQGVFRTDLPTDWLVTLTFSLLHTAADEVEADRLTPEAVPGLLTATLLSALAPPAGRTVPG